MVRSNLIRRWVLAMSCFLVTVRLSHESFAGGNVYPGATWETRSPEEVGLARSKLRDLALMVEGRGCVVRHGYLVFGWGDVAKSADVASAFKPVLSTLLFFAIQEGKVRGVDEPVSDFEPRLKTLNQGKDGAITWRHLASQTSGYGLAERPGQAYAYNDYALALYYDTLTVKVFGTNGTELLRRYLAEPLQFEDSFSFEALGPNKPGRLAVSVRDFARFGLLYLHQGRWRDKQILEAKFVEQAIHSPISADTPLTSGREAEMLPGARTVGGTRNITGAGPGFYSFNWWTNGKNERGERLFHDCPPDTFIAAGHGGKRMLWVFPSLDLIVVWNGSPIEDFDNSPSEPRTRCNKAARLMMESVVGEAGVSRPETRPAATAR